MLLALAISAAATAWWTRYSPVRWARLEALPEIQRLVEQDRVYEAFFLARRAARSIPDDFHLRSLMEELSVNASISPNPDGAEIRIKDYLTPDAEWDL